MFPISFLRILILFYHNLLFPIRVYETGLFFMTESRAENRAFQMRESTFSPATAGGRALSLPL